MKKTKRNQNVVHALLLALLAGLALWSYSHLQQAQATTQIASQNYSRSKRAATQIAEYKKKTQVAGTQKMADAEISRNIDLAANVAGIPQSCIQGAYPGSARRLGDSSFKEMPTEVPLRNITLKQLITFLHQLSTGPAKLGIKSVRLEAPRKKSLSNRWNADIILTYLIYSVNKKKS